MLRVAAALSITTFYRSSLAASKEAYSSGYLTCLQDTLQFIQAGVSVSGSSGEEMTIGRVMDWLEARLEAIKSTEEEEEEDRMKEGALKSSQEEPSKEERDKRFRKGMNTVTPQVKLQRRSKENLQDPLHPMDSSIQTIPTVSTSSPSPPPQRPMKAKKGLKEFGFGVPSNETDSSLPLAITSAADSSSPFTFAPDRILPFPTAGSKRRHATMVAESPGSSSGTLTSSPSGSIHAHITSRRRRGRGVPSVQTVNPSSGVSQVSVGEAMDIEEDGRERKRVARR